MKKITLILIAGFLFYQPNFALAQNTCQNECSFYGQRQSEGTSGRTCGNYDSDSCLEWSAWQSCDIQTYFCGDNTCNAQCGESYLNCSKDCVSNPTISVSAGSSQETWEGSSIVLEGTSFQSGGGIRSNRWSCNGGSVSTPDALKTTYFTPSVLRDTNLLCTLTATDYQDRTGSSNVAITVKKRVPTLVLEALARNITQGQTGWQKIISALPSDKIEFKIKVTATSTADTLNILLKDILPDGISYLGNLKIDGSSSKENVISSLNIGDLTRGNSRIITFEGKIFSLNNFTQGTTGLINTIQARANYMPEISDTVAVNVIKPPAAFTLAVDAGTSTGMASSEAAGTTTNLVGQAAKVSTGIAGDIFKSLLPPLMLAAILVLAFRSKILYFNEWLDKRRVKIRNYQTKRTLKSKIHRIKNSEREVYETWKR
ncbi:MAG: hypothetical protein Q7K28_01340 [Candidatus Wildermuthbacteria bacterium]|nr:hypothetical protein [Candidatus Wildermuthbacteria bacterium]